MHPHVVPSRPSGAGRAQAGGCGHHLSEELLSHRVRVMQQVNGREGSGRLLLGAGLVGAHGALQLALLLVAAARRLRAFLAERLAQLLDLSLGHASLLLIRVLTGFGGVVLAQQEMERREPQLGMRAEEGRRNHVDGLLVAPHVPPVQLDHRPQRVLCADGRRGILQDADDVVLQRAVERLVAVLLVGGLDVRHHVRVEPRPQHLVAAPEEAEAALQQGERRHQSAVAQEHQRLQDGAPHGRLEHVVPLVDEFAETLGHVGHHRREAGRDDGQQRLEVAQAAGDLLRVAIRVTTNEILQRHERGRPQHSRALEPARGVSTFFSSVQALHT
eukprot:scaffold4641_cov117-Isochrysis_galbana.AAC.14